MKNNQNKNNTVDHYIAQFPKETQLLLKQLRATIKKIAPKAEEVISYNMPAYKYHGMLVYFAGYQHHIGFYPMPAAIKEFKQELIKYKQANGSVQFPIDQKLPLNLISKMIKFRVAQNLEKIELKKQNSKVDFFSLLSAPALRALENKGIKTVKQLSKFTESEILELHGIGASSIPILKKALKAEKLTFKNK